MVATAAHRLGSLRASQSPPAAASVTTAGTIRSARNAWGIPSLDKITGNIATAIHPAKTPRAAKINPSAKRIATGQNSSGRYGILCRQLLSPFAKNMRAVFHALSARAFNGGGEASAETAGARPANAERRVAK